MRQILPSSKSLNIYHSKYLFKYIFIVNVNIRRCECVFIFFLKYAAVNVYLFAFTLINYFNPITVMKWNSHLIKLSYLFYNLIM